MREWLSWWRPGRTTWQGKALLLWHPVRRLFRRPAPRYERCILGSLVTPWLHCPRRATTALWCRRHVPKAGES